MQRILGKRYCNNFLNLEGTSWGWSLRFQLQKAGGDWSGCRVVGSLDGQITILSLFSSPSLRRLELVFMGAKGKKPSSTNFLGRYAWITQFPGNIWEINFIYSIAHLRGTSLKGNWGLLRQVEKPCGEEKNLFYILPPFWTSEIHSSPVISICTVSSFQLCVAFLKNKIKQSPTKTV